MCQEGVVGNVEEANDGEDVPVRFGRLMEEQFGCHHCCNSGITISNLGRDR